MNKCTFIYYQKKTLSFDLYTWQGFQDPFGKKDIGGVNLHVQNATKLYHRLKVFVTILGVTQVRN